MGRTCSSLFSLAIRSLSVRSLSRAWLMASPLNRSSLNSDTTAVTCTHTHTQTHTIICQCLSRRAIHSSAVVIWQRLALHEPITSEFVLICFHWWEFITRLHPSLWTPTVKKFDLGISDLTVSFYMWLKGHGTNTYLGLQVVCSLTQLVSFLLWLFQTSPQSGDLILINRMWYNYNGVKKCFYYTTSQYTMLTWRIPLKFLR